MAHTAAARKSDSVNGAKKKNAVGKIEMATTVASATPSSKSSATRRRSPVIARTYAAPAMASPPRAIAPSRIRPTSPVSSGKSGKKLTLF